MSTASQLSDHVEEYLEAIHKLNQSPRGASTTGLAQLLNVKPASVTGMLQRLAEFGLIVYRRYHNIVLTTEGEARAHDLIRRHRLAERLLTDVLKVPLDEAHDQACRLEHVVSPDLGNRIADALGDPEACPHGHPIDASTNDHTFSLLDAPLHHPIMIIRLQDESPEAIRDLTKRGLLPGAVIKIESRRLSADKLVLTAGDKKHMIEFSLAAGIRVQVMTEEEV